MMQAPFPLPTRFRFRPCAMALAVLGAMAAVVPALVGGALTTGAALVLAPPPAAAQQVQRIAAVVNDDVISLHDVQARLTLAIRSAQLPETQETRQRLLPQVLQQLIDERLKAQEGKRLGVDVSPEELLAARRQVERNNDMPPGALDRFLTEAGIDETSFEAQLRAEILWAKIAQTELIQSVTIEPEEIDALLESLRQTMGSPERLLAEILLPVDSPDQDAAVRAFAERLIAEVDQGAPFPAVARQFSLAPTAAVGGDLGWVMEGTMDPRIEGALAALAPGQLTPPVRTAQGYHILALRDRRDPRAIPADQIPMDLSQLLMPLSGPAALPEARRTELGQTLPGRLTSCDDVNQEAESLGLPSSGPIGVLRLADLPPAVAAVVQGLPEKRLSPPIVVDGRAEVMIMVCERLSPLSLPSRERIEMQLEAEKLERVAQRTLRNLRRAALIDIRL